jgi:AraC family transcriptional regulator
MATLGQPSRSDHHERIPAHKMPDYLPATAHQPFGQSLNSQVQMLLDLAARDIVSCPDGVQRLREVSGERDPEVTELMKSLYHEVTSNSQASSLYLQGVGQALAVHLARRYGDGSEPSKRMSALPAYKLHRAIATLQTGMGSAFSLDRMASEAGMSVSHFSRLFKKATGRSPSQYFIHLRMETARELLLESDLSILCVALEVGYASPSYFAQLFRRHTGITPREYRHRS